ncbi:MAG: hypothetical protein J5801_00745 [Bacteroidales bacterium]|nr:hypothetical protein [Bacteroidales bacterium]
MKKLVLLSFILLALCTGAWAQGTANPAESAFLEYGFVRVGEIQSITRNNVGAASFLFPSGGKLVTGLHSSISSEEFLGGLEAVNSMYSQINYNLFSYGWKSSARGFHTLEAGARVNYGLSVPKEILQILKTGTAQSPYDLSSLKAFGNVYGEIAYGYSLPLSDKFSVGGRVKLLLGLYSVDVSARKFSLTTTEDQYKVDLDADVDLTSTSTKVGTDESGYLDYKSFSGKGKFGLPSGAGLAVDLGAVWKPFSGFTLSASVLDLGGILWYYGNAGTSSGSYSFEGLKNLTTDELDQEHISSRLKDAGEEVLNVIKPKAVNGSYKFKAVPLTANMKASYAMPFWERLSVDASCLYTGYNYCAPYWEARGGLSIDFPDIAHLGLNAGSGAYGFVYGVNGSVEFKSFRLYASYENGIGGVIPYGSTPLKANNKTLLFGLVYLIK